MNVVANTTSGQTQGRCRKTTKSSSFISPGDCVNVFDDSSSGKNRKKSKKKTRLNNDKFVVASFISEKEPKSETVPMNIDWGDDEVSNSKFLGDSILLEEAKLCWPKRYLEKEKKKTRSRSNSDGDEVLQARCHYTEAKVDGGVIYKLYDDAHVKGEKYD